jgi:hypothetical protein
VGKNAKSADQNRNNGVADPVRNIALNISDGSGRPEVDNVIDNIGARSAEP